MLPPCAKFGAPVAMLPLRDPLPLGERLELDLNLMYKFGIRLNFDDRLATRRVVALFGRRKVDCGPERR